MITRAKLLSRRGAWGLKWSPPLPRGREDGGEGRKIAGIFHSKKPKAFIGPIRPWSIIQIPGRGTGGGPAAGGHGPRARASRCILPGAIAAAPLFLVSSRISVPKGHAERAHRNWGAGFGTMPAPHKGRGDVGRSQGGPHPNRLTKRSIFGARSGTTPRGRQEREVFLLRGDFRGRNTGPCVGRGGAGEGRDSMPGPGGRFRKAGASRVVSRKSGLETHRKTGGGGKKPRRCFARRLAGPGLSHRHHQSRAGNFGGDPPGTPRPTGSGENPSPARGAFAGAAGEGGFPGRWPTSWHRRV